MKNTFLILTPLFLTLKWLTLSLVFNSKLIYYKQKWAQSILDFIGYEVIEIDKNQKCEKGPLIYVGNHISFLDILVLMSAEPRLVFLAKIQVKNWPIIGWAATRVGTLYVDRDSKSHRNQTRYQLGHTLNDKKAHVVVFPSGTTSYNEELPWKKGMFEIAKDNKIKVQSFKIKYDPKNISTYVGDEKISEKLIQQIKTPHKKAYLIWSENYDIHDPLTQAEVIRKNIVKI